MSDESEDAAENDADDITDVDAVSTAQTASLARVFDGRETAWLLLYRVNFELASTLGRDFELGHSYLLAVADADTESEQWQSLARAWDQAIYPQLQERFANCPDELLRLLRSDRQGGAQPRGYLITRRGDPASATHTARGRTVVNVPSLELASRNRLDQVIITLRRLAGV